MLQLITPSLKLKYAMLYEKVHIPIAYRTNFNNSEKLLSCGSFSETWDLSQKPSSLTIKPCFWECDALKEILFAFKYTFLHLQGCWYLLIDA